MDSYEVGEYIDIDENTYHAKIEGWSYTDEPSQFSGRPQIMIRWNLVEIQNDDGSDVIKTQYVNDPPKGLGDPRSTLYQVFSAALENGQALPIGKVYTKDMLVGKEAELYYGSYIRKDGTKGMKIRSVSAPKKKSAPQTGGAGVRRRDVDQEDDADKAAKLAAIASA